VNVFIGSISNTYDYDEVKVSLQKRTMAFYKPLPATMTLGIAAALSISAQKTPRRGKKNDRQTSSKMRPRSFLGRCLKPCERSDAKKRARPLPHPAILT